MKVLRYIYVFLLIIICLSTKAQVFEVKGHVADSLTKQNKAFVNIVINDDMTLGTSTDIDGNFAIASKNEIRKLTFSYIGYKTKVIKIDASRQSSINVLLKREDVEIQEVVVHAGENPAHRIIENVVKNRKKNDPENLDSYSYIIFDRMILTLDTTLITDSVMMRFKEHMRRNDLMIMETVSQKYHKKPNKNKRMIQANIITGMSDPTYFYVLDGIQSASFYDEYIKINDKDYVNPLTPGSTSRYFFNIESKMPTEAGDTIFQISYKPRKNTVFNGLSGVLTIHSDGWALANVKAEPAEQSDSNSPFQFKFKIQQLYAKVNDSVWFPQQLNTDIEFFEFLVDDNNQVFMAAKPGEKNHLKMIGIGKSYISNVKVNEAIDNKIFGNTDIDMAEDSGSRDESFWRDYRNDSVSKRVSSTDKFVNRVEKKVGVDLDETINKAMTFVENASLPVGVFDLKLNEILSYDDADGFYLGFGARTNHKLSTRFNVGAYAGFWFASKTFNYGADFKLRMDKKHNFDFDVAFDRSFEKVGNYGFPDKEYNPLDESCYKYFYMKWTTLNTSVSAELSRRFGKIFHGFAKFSVTGVNDDYMNKSIDYWGQFMVSKLELKLKIAFGERLMGTQKGLVVVEKGEPVVWLGYQKGLKGVLGNAFNFDKIQFQFSDNWRFRYLGESSLTIQAGCVFGDAPFNEVFSMFGTGSRFGLYANESFATMGPTEFFCDRFAALFFSHNFGKLFNSKVFKPEFIFLTNIGVGDLRNPEKYTTAYHEFKCIKDGYYESGLAIDNILDLKTAHIGFACLYRYGPYSFDKVGDNFAYKIKITFSF